MIPKVSVIIPCYNCQDFIRGTIASILAQSYKDYEIIAVDDGSTDRTAEIIFEFGSKVQYIYQSNGGPAGGRNAGIARARGEYIAFLDHDDEWLPDKLDKQMGLFEKDRKIGLVHTNAYMLKSTSFSMPDPKCDKRFQLWHPHRGKVTDRLFLENFIATSSVVVRKECFEKFGLFNPALSPGEDYDRWLRFSTGFDFDHVDEPLVKFRDHAASFKKDEAVTIKRTIATLEGFVKDYPYVEAGLGAKVHKRMAYYYILLGREFLLKGESKSAFEHFGKALQITGSPVTIFGIVNTVLSAYARRILKRNGMRQ